MEQGQAYWEERAKKGHDEDGFEWFTIDFAKLEPMLKETGALDTSTKVLEVGCGTSHLLLHLAQARGGSGTNLYGMDYSPTCIARQRQMMTLEDISRIPELYAMDASQMDAFSTHSLDVILDKGALDSVDMTDSNVAACATEYTRVLQPGGQICLVTCRWPLKRRLECLQDLPLRMRQAQLFKAPGQEHAPGGFGAFLLERMPDGYQFQVNDVCLDDYLAVSNSNDYPADYDDKTAGYFDRGGEPCFADEVDDLFGALGPVMEAF